MAELRTWRQRLATPLKRVEEEKPPETSPDNRTNRTNPDLLRVSLSETVFGQTSEKPDKPRLVRIGPNTWKEADWCRGLCVNCEEPLAPGDVIACTWHRAQIDALVMPWETDS